MYKALIAMTDYEKQRYVQTCLVNDHAKSKVLGHSGQTTTEHHFDLWRQLYNHSNTAQTDPGMTKGA